jgi:hypothetical protein
MTAAAVLTRGIVIEEFVERRSNSLAGTNQLASWYA